MSKDKNYELEYLRLQNEMMQKKLDESNSISDKELVQLIELAAQMRELLMLCRSQQIDYKLARKIDDVLRQATDLD
jgi:hypothetical protein